MQGAIGTLSRELDQVWPRSNKKLDDIRTTVYQCETLWPFEMEEAFEKAMLYLKHVGATPGKNEAVCCSYKIHPECTRTFRLNNKIVELRDEDLAGLVGVRQMRNAIIVCVHH